MMIGSAFMLLTAINIDL